MMDSGLGSDEDRGRGRTKEQKQLRNQQLLSGCFIDAASLSDDNDVVDQRRSDERRQGALVFQSAIPQFSMLQMGEAPIQFQPDDEPDTPYNSIVHLEQEEEEAARKSPLGFFVDLSDVTSAPQPQTPPSATKKNIFSMVIDFEAPKKEKPVKLTSSLTTYKKKNRQLTLTSAKCNGSSGSLSSSISSISSAAAVAAGPSRQTEEEMKENRVSTTEEEQNGNQSMCSSKSSNCSSQEKEAISSNEQFKEKVEQDPISERTEENVDILPMKEMELSTNTQNPPQFVKLSDLECQKPKVDLNFTPRMSKSIPESSWVESPLLMSRSAGYRSAPHPLEPESGELSDSGSATDTSVSQPRKSVQRLGTDLLRMFLEEIGPDVTVEVDGHRLKAHKCILASRCQYFAALLSGNWLEASGNIISLQGFSYESVYFALCHIYSGAAHVPDSISLVELASLADMLGLEGLKEVVEHALKQRHCHNFHKPCAGCCTGVLEVLPLSAAYGLDDLYQKCLQWITHNFVRIWPSRAFATLPRELREKCYQQHVVHMTSDKVLETITACDKVLTTLPAQRWAEPITQLVLQLSDACHLYHRQHFAAVLASPSFLALDAGLGWSVAQVEDQLIGAAKNLGIEQACKSYTRCYKMLEQHHWSRPFTDLLHKIKLQLEQCLVGQADRLIRSNAWLRLDSVLRSRIKDLTPVSEPISRLPRKKKLPLQNISKSSSTVTMASSTDSSRNSSPGMNQTSRLHNSSGSPSLRRSLLLAARAPQVPPSPSTHRKSTLTQPTAASAAKSAPSKHLRNVQYSNNNNSSQSTPSKKTTPTTGTTSVRKSTPISSASSTSRSSTGSNIRKMATGSGAVVRKPISRSNSPLKTDGSASSSPRKFGSNATSPMKNDGRIISTKNLNKGISSPKKNVCKKLVPDSTKIVNSTQPTPTMQRSSTFLKDEPTILGKI